jgi:hypothetical protein
MPLNPTGPISLGGNTLGESVALQLGLAPTGPISLNDAVVRALAEVPTGTIIMPDNFWGKPSAFIFTPTVTVPTTDFNLYNAAVAAGWDQSSVLNATITIDGGATLRSSSTSTAALDASGPFPPGSVLALINNGNVLGLRGLAGAGGVAINTANPIRNGTPGQNGGPAISLGLALTLTNNGIIAGGGGGGGGGGGADYGGGLGFWQGVGGSGGGGGADFGPGGAGGITIMPGGSAVRNGYNGSPGTATTGGAGGPFGVYSGFFAIGGAGGKGGDLGQPGTAGSSPPPGYTAFPSSGGAGGAAGNAIIVNGNSITYLVSGQIYGPIS